ncbi:calcium-binding protein [Candidatus Regiella endosymbiont of Tuberolachnus salignus]|uniref:calcium-binding protein n=1 Tax=Candidatus Regiella endosymbiont of Tuberolachnus salignus TaxID=3077956 RepID=UPI0030CA98C5
MNREEASTGHFKVAKSGQSKVALTSEDSNIILDYDVQNIDSIELSLNSHKIICLLKNPNGSKTTLYLNDAYTLSADGKELILKNKYSLLTHDGVLLDADSWPPSIKQQNGRWVLPPLPVRYVSSYDRSGEVLKNPDSEQNFIQLQQESGIITVNGHQRVLPKSMRLLLIDTGFNDSLEGDNTDNMLYSFGRGDRLKGSGGSDIYHLYHAQQTDRKIVIDNEDPRKMLDFLQLNSVTIDKLNHISKENNDIILSSAIRDPRIGSVDIRIKNFYLHDNYRHVAISDKESDRYLLDIDSEDNQVYFYRLHFDEKQGKFYCGQKQVNPQATTGNDILALSGAITLLDNTFNALAGNDEIIDQSHGDRTLRGGEGNDILLAGYQQNGVKTFYGDQGNDQLYGGRENDKLFGGAGKDTLKGNGGDDDLDGGEGDDSYLYLRGDGRDFITDSGGTDKLILLGEIAESDVQLEIDGQDLRLTITPDHLHSEGSISFSNQIEQIKVGQTIYNTAQLIQAVSAFRTERRSAYSISLNELITYRPGQWLTAPPMETLKNS